MFLNLKAKEPEVCVPSAGDLLLRDILKCVQTEESKKYEVVIQFQGRIIVQGREALGMQIVDSKLITD